MATFHHVRRLSKIILYSPDETASVAEMTATIQINERQQNWPPTQQRTRHQKAPVWLNLAAIKF